jgi:hypothetical protein
VHTLLQSISKAICTCLTGTSTHGSRCHKAVALDTMICHKLAKGRM